MKIAIMLGRGIEGVGNTKSAIELQKFLIKNNECDTYYFDCKNWTRRKSMTNNFIKIDINETKKYSDILSTYDLVIYLSIPPKNLAIEITDNFLENLVKNVKTVKYQIVVDHSILSIIRNANNVEIANEMDVVFMHSLEGDFSKYLDKHEVKTRKEWLSLGYNFEEMKRFWKPIEQQKERTLKFIGRSAFWKGSELLYRLHNEALKNHNFETTLEGMEKSIGALRLFYKNANRKEGIRDDIFDMVTEKIKFDDVDHNKKMFVNGPYNYIECMERLSKCQFGSDLYNLKPHKYGYSAEYCHLDCLGCGTIPIFHKHFGMNCKNILTNKPHYDVNKSEVENFNETGTLWLDEKNIFFIKSLMLKLINDNSQRDKMRNVAYNYWKECCNIDVVYNKILEVFNETKI